MPKILIIDDSTFMCNKLTSMLNKEGFKDVTQAQTGQEALKLYKKEKPDLILLDLILPKVNGLELLKQFKKAKVIVVSAIGHEKIIKRTKLSGICDYIVKPFSSEIVILKVKRALTKK